LNRVLGIVFKLCTPFRRNWTAKQCIEATMTSNVKVSGNNKRRLWLSPEEFSNLTGDATPSKKDCSIDRNERTVTEDTYDTIFKQFSSKPNPKSLSFHLLSAVVLVQEFVLTCFLLAGHRAARLEELNYIRRWEKGIPTDYGIRSLRLLTSLGLIWITLVVAVVQNRFASSKRYTIRHRFTDFLLMAILLRFLSAVLKTLTASYSSDTVYVLSTMSLFLHLLACNYDYANGLNDNQNDGNDCTSRNNTSHSNGVYYKKRNLERPTFEGGIISLTSAFFATTLLASRLESNAAVYIFVCSSVILFALYPAARHLVAVKAAQHVGAWVPLFVSGILTLALTILLEPGETLMVLTVIVFIGIFVPTWKHYLQLYKIRLRGPWDIAHV